MTDRIKIPAGNPVTPMGRILDGDGADMTISSVSSISVRVTELNSLIVTLQADLTIADVVFDTLQETSSPTRWTFDTIGYNFRHTIDGTVAFPDPYRTYKVEHLITPASGLSFVGVIGEVTTTKQHTR